jgi:hypothetical protein
MTTSTTSHHRIADVHRRTRNILDALPASTWTLEEAEIIVEALSTIVRARQAGQKAAVTPV